MLKVLSLINKQWSLNYKARHSDSRVKLKIFKNERRVGIKNVLFFLNELFLLVFLNGVHKGN